MVPVTTKVLIVVLIDLASSLEPLSRLVNRRNDMIPSATHLYLQSKYSEDKHSCKFSLAVIVPSGMSLPVAEQK